MDTSHQLMTAVIGSDSNLVADIIAHAHPRRGANHHDAAILFSSQCAIGDVLSTSQIIEWAVSNGFIELDGEVPSPPVLMTNGDGKKEWSKSEGSWRLAQTKAVNFINAMNKAASHPRFVQEGHTPFVIMSARKSKARNMWAVRAVPETVREWDFIEPVLGHSRAILKKYEETATGLDIDNENISEIAKTNWRLYEMREFVNTLEGAWDKFKRDMTNKDAIIDFAVKSIMSSMPQIEEG